ncbi:site-specific integrase [Rhizobium hainanense]|uniref:Phage integrase family protein n=1 Tax=Rhizobium hainanense TaxID=52131 RepID=A0A1C3UMA3_9HYPH|nr:site-specific integrase [Rhizobium hainanense]SCB16588.1 Phage integrase family protein [Rhizobium hainanense]
MGTISERTRRNGTKAYTAQIRMKRGGKLVHTEAQTFDRKPAAKAWLNKREAALDEPGALQRLLRPDVTLADAIDQYLKDSVKDIGRTKTQVLNVIKKHELAFMRCGEIASTDLTRFAKDLAVGWNPDTNGREESIARKPQTVGNYMSHLASIFAIARPMWGYELSEQAFRDATKVLKWLGIISRSGERKRRPTLAELKLLLTYFFERSQRTVEASPMHKIILFGIFSTRRQEEITTLRWDDLDRENMEILVRDMKHPDQKIGNDVRCSLTPEALIIIDAMPKVGPRIFPFNPGTISSNFTNTCKMLGIDDLHFHDMRHEGISRLFELGWEIPRVATVSGHRSWNSLKRYTHIRKKGDKYADWLWMKITKD